MLEDDGAHQEDDAGHQALGLWTAIKRRTAVRIEERSGIRDQALAALSAGFPNRLQPQIGGPVLGFAPLCYADCEGDLEPQMSDDGGFCDHQQVGQCPGA